MTTYELVIEMKLLERRLTLYEEKYGILSEDFYAALMAGKFSQYDDYDETRNDFSRWKGIYETWLRRKRAYATQIQQSEIAKSLHLQLRDV
jgi:hypothetical protein